MLDKVCPPSLFPWVAQRPKVWISTARRQLAGLMFPYPDARLDRG
jgi:hypothetical protein